MKLPTLNVDVAVNTSTLEKDIARANKQIQQIGGKALAFTGGLGGKIGALGSLGGTAGTMAIGFGGIAAAFGALDAVQNSFVSSLKDAESAVKSFSETGKTGGMNIVAAQILSEQSARMTELQKRGLFGGVGESFMAAAQGPQGNPFEDFIQSLSESLRFGAGIAGGLLSGRDLSDIVKTATAMAVTDQTVAQVAAGPGDMQSMLRAVVENAYRQRKQDRELNT